MKRLFVILITCILFIGCSKQQILSGNSKESINLQNEEFKNESNRENENKMQMNVKVGDRNFIATLKDNEAVDVLVEMLKETGITIKMSDYAGFEKVGALETNLPTNNQQTTTQPGDIMLYQGNQIVLFYGSNTWNYTQIGHINNLSGWQEALGNGDVTITLSLEKKVG